MNENVINESRKLIAGFLKERRKELGLTQEDLAGKIGVKRQTIQRIEDAKFFPSMALFLEMTHHLQCYFFLETKESSSEAATAMRERWGKMGEN